MTIQRLTILALTVAVASTFAGCKRTGTHGASADIRHRIFEVPAELLDEVVPPEKRTSITNSTYSIAQGSQADLSTLMDGMLSDSGLLVDASRRISVWPKTADTWAYSKTDGELLGGGSGAGFVGVRSRGGHHEIRIEYDVNHTINTREPIQSKLTYEGALADDGVLIALRPFKRTDGVAVVHIVAFEAENWR